MRWDRIEIVNSCKNGLQEIVNSCKNALIKTVNSVLIFPAEGDKLLKKAVIFNAFLRAGGTDVQEKDLQ